MSRLEDDKALAAWLAQSHDEPEDDYVRRVKQWARDFAAAEAAQHDVDVILPAETALGWLRLAKWLRSGGLAQEAGDD